MLRGALAVGRRIAQGNTRIPDGSIGDFMSDGLAVCISNPIRLQGACVSLKLPFYFSRCLDLPSFCGFDISCPRASF